MKVLFVSGEMIAGDVAYRLKQEGCEVKLYIEDESRRDCFDGMVIKTKDWKKELNWVGRDGLIVFDDVGYGYEQDKLRKMGYAVYGNCRAGDLLEKNREYAQNLFKTHGIEIEESKNFSDSKTAINYIKKNKSYWVVKQNCHDGALAYVGSMADGSDVISVIESYKKYNKSKAVKTLSLQKKIEGVEVAIARFFNGSDWNGPIFVSFEHKPFLNEDIGPLTAEMGTLAWYDEDEKNKIFQATLEKIKPHLKKIDYRGYVDINSIINGNRITPLEATARLGSPTNHLQSSMQLTPWKDILLSTARGEKTKFLFKKGYAIVVSIAIPPFPYKPSPADNSYYLKGVNILFQDKISEEEWSRIHFEEVSLKNKNQYYITGNNGYILFVNGIGETVAKARENAYSLVRKIVIPKMMYRTDIGVKFMEKDQNLLKKWGWL